MKDQFENVIIKGVHATRYIMSWVREGGQLTHRGKGVDKFRDWLNSLELSEEECDTILHLARNGRMELEMSASAYLKKISEPK